jgi:DNA-directed RNA polymerase sigma subunit (sigma70/sigma32)
VQRYNDSHASLIPIPNNIVEQNKKNSKIISELLNKNGYFPTPDEIIEASGNESYLICANNFESFETNIGNGEDNLMIQDVIKDNSIISASDIVEHSILSNKIRQIVSRLNDREKTIIEMSYGWGIDGKSYTHKDIMNRLGIEIYAFNKLKKSAYEHLQDFVEDDSDFDNWKAVFAGVDNVD